MSTKIFQRIAGLLVTFTLLVLTACSSVQMATPGPTPAQSPVVPQGTFVYVGGIAASPDSVFPTSDTDELTSYQVQPDGSLKRLGAFDRSALPQAIFESAAAGPWFFTCDASGNCLEFRVDNTGNLVHGADISKTHLIQIAGIDPTGNWLIASDARGEHAFRIQPDGTLVAGPDTPAPPQPPGSFPGLLSFFIMRFDPTGNFAFARNLTGSTEDPAVYRFNSNNGTFTRVSSLPGPGVTAIGSLFMGFTSDGRHAIGEQELSAGPGADVYIFDWDSNAGVLSVHSHGVSDLFPASIAMADNLIFVEGIPTNAVLRFDPTTVTISDTGRRFDNNAVEDGPLFADSRTHTVIGTSPGGNLVGIWKYDPTTGAAQTAPGSPYPAAQNAYILEVLSH
ncbi:MAG TPA: hypothetical protein VKV30_08375 [Candidatus Angelobacter sp.]|nr:hypothetical protein [Candidatus Angelobacter sp.]